ncbi:MAG: insulinase family protein [Luminiphilus sp.]|nr:insulinase family protein [Luminiphilus sp.]
MTEASRTSETHPYPNTFVRQRAVPIPSMNLTVEEYVHPGTGAVHLHMGAESAENVFMVALRTVPEDSTGVAHILEHTALCGSERYPVRDPFFMMLRRSLNTFMNAFTSSDWTAYPFATQNRKDFGNLLDVYLDAVFFSRLDPLDFAQEGHRVEFENDDATAPLVFKGVVFNEMKGAMSSTPSVLWDRLCHELFPSNTYHFNSGGDPERIPDLTYQQLRDFYAEHYHPSNAIFLTFGDIPAEDHQLKFESAVLHRFQALGRKIEVELEHTFAAPRAAVHPFVVDPEENGDNKTHLIMGWKLGESADLTAMLEAQLVSSVLMENSASPLMHYLETTALGTAPSPLCGLEESMREMVFCCGIEGSEAAHAETFEREVLACIEQIAHNGVDPDKIEAILRQIELHQREVSGDGMPYGLNLMLRALSAATHYGDAVAALDLEPVIASLRQRVKDPDYIPHLIKAMLIDNPHRVRLVVEPDPKLSQEREAAEAARLAEMKSTLSGEHTAEILDLATRLRDRQAQKDDPDVLPRVELADIPAEIPSPVPEIQEGDSTLYRYTAGTNGLVYQQWGSRLPALTAGEQEHLPLLTALMAEVGVGDLDYLEAQDRHSATVGSLNASVSSRAHRDDEQSADSYFVLSSKALADRISPQLELMSDTLQAARFDEPSRIRDLISQIRARRDQGITGNGHMLAMSAACSGMSPLARRTHEQGGLEGIRRMRALDEALNQDGELETLAASLSAVHQKIAGAGAPVLCTIADTPNIEAAASAAQSIVARLPRADQETGRASPIREAKHEMWVTNTQVNFCARAYPTVPSGHADAPVLTVLGAFLRNGFLHRSIREQGGAYGGGASHDANIGAFRFFSYRDPRLLETLNDFDASVRWLLDSRHERLALEEAILSVVASLDKPGSPAGEAKRHFHECLFGRTDEHRRSFRAGIVNTTLDDMRRVAECYLRPESVSTAVVTHVSGAEEILAGGLTLIRQELL